MADEEQRERWLRIVLSLSIERKPGRAAHLDWRLRRLAYGTSCPFSALSAFASSSSSLDLLHPPLHSFEFESSEQSRDGTPN